MPLINLLIAILAVVEYIKGQKRDKETICVFSIAIGFILFLVLPKAMIITSIMYSIWSMREG